MDFGKYSFTRYLAAKRSVDDRALNRQVWQILVENLPASGPDHPLRVLEIGCGTGTMLARMLEWGLLGHAEYTGIDASAENIAAAWDSLSAWGQDRGSTTAEDEPERGLAKQGTNPGPQRPQGLNLHLEGNRGRIASDLQAVDLFDFIPREAGRRSWDLLVAHAFLDLVNIPNALTQIFSLAHLGTLFYFTLVFDGATLFEPCLEQDMDDTVERLYHRTMDQRITDARPSGDSRAGRHLFGYLQNAGARVLAAGASDWVVFPGTDGYPGDEAYFLHFIIHTVESALSGHPDLEPDRFRSWIAARHAQVERGELLYIAHQLDFVGIVKDET